MLKFKTLICANACNKVKHEHECDCEYKNTKANNHHRFSLGRSPASHLIVPFKFPVNWHCSQTVLRSNRLDKCEEGDHLFGCIFFLFVSSSSSLPYFFAVCFFFFPIIGKLLSLTNWNSIFEWASECTSVNERNIKIKTVFWHWHRRKQRRQWQIFIYTFSTLYRFRFPLTSYVTHAKTPHTIHLMQQTHFPNNWQIFMNEFQFVLYVSI